jgi:proline iminopeptidase
VSRTKIFIKINPVKMVSNHNKIRSVYICFIVFLFLYSACRNSAQVINSGNNELQVAKGFIEVSGAKLNYVVEGKGKPCLVIGSSIYYPRTFSKQLRDSLKFYFVDMRWFAREFTPVKPEYFTLDTIISDIEKIRTQLKLEKMIILGHSIHSVIAFEYAKRYPDRVSHVIMIGSPAYQTNKIQEDAIINAWKTASPDRHRLQDENWKKLAEMKNLSPAQFEIENYCLMAPKYWYDMHYDAKWLWKDMTLNTDLLNILYGSIFRDYFIFKNERSVPVPTFVALGKFDYVDPCTLWEGFVDIPGLTVRVFEKSGHTPQLEESAGFNNQLLKWLRDN